MNKVVALSLVSVFLLSILVGYLPVLTTQAATGNPQTNIVMISPPYYVAVVITGVNFPPLPLYGEIATALNQTLNYTKVTINVVNVQNGQTAYSFTGTVAIKDNVKYFDAYYSPAANAVLILYAINQTAPTTLPMGDVLNKIYQDLGINLVNNTYPFLVNITGGKVYSNQSAVFVTANVIVNSQNVPLSQYQVNYNGVSTPLINLITSETTLQHNNWELTISVAPMSSPTQVLAPSANTVIFAPITIVKIYNEMLNDQAIGAGRSLINITVYNPIQTTTSYYVYQLNYTGPGPISVNFYPAFQIFSADQLYFLKPTVGIFTFNGTTYNNQLYGFPLNYTLIILDYVPPGVAVPPHIDVKPYYNGGKTAGNEVPITGSTLPLTVSLNNPTNPTASAAFAGRIYAFAITFTDEKQNGQLVYQPTYTIAGVTHPVYVEFQGVQIPLFAVYVNSTAYALQIKGLNWFYLSAPGIFQTIKIPKFNLTMVYKLPLKPLVVNTQLSVSSYEALAASSYNALGGNQYGGTIFTTPPTQGPILGTYTLTGNATVGTTYTNVYVTGFGVYPFKNLNSTGVYERIAIEGVVATPAYPILNGTVFTGLTLAAQTIIQNNYVQMNVYRNPFGVQQVGFIPGSGIIQIATTTLPLTMTAFYGAYAPQANLPEVVTINLAPTQLKLIVPNNLFYIALVELGLWTNQTIVYVKGWAVTTVGTLEMYGVSYFDALIAPVTMTMSSVTPSDFVCNNVVWVAFKSPDDVEVTGTYYGQYALTVTNLRNAPVNFNPPGAPATVEGALVVPTNSPNLPITPITVRETFTNYFVSSGYISVPLNQIAQSPPQQYLVTNYPGISNYTEQTGVPGGLVITGSLPNGVPLNWTGVNPAPGLMRTPAGVLVVNAVNLLPMPQPGTVIPTPVFNLTIYLRYQVDYAAPANPGAFGPGTVLKPDFYYGANNSIIVITPPNLTVGARITVSFVSGDFADHYFFSNSKQYWNRTVTIIVPNVTLTLKAPKVAPLYKGTVPVQLIEPYYAAPYPAQLQVGTNTVTLLANTYNFFGVIPKSYAVGVGKFVNITIRFANGTTEKILLIGTNVSTLFQGGTLNENGSCTGAYNATISISGLLKILHLTSVSKLNGSCLYITYYDNITHTTATAKICFGGVSVVSPIQIMPALIFYVLTAKYVNATAGLPVTLAQSVAVQPFVSLNDTFLAKSLAGVVANLNVTNVTIIDHYGNKYVIYYNSTNGSTNVMINGKIMYAYSGYKLPTVPETAPNTGIFTGSPITFVVNMPGTIYKNGTVFNGTLAVKLGSNVATLGPATNFALPAFSFAGKLFGYNSTMYVTVEDPVTGSTLTLKTYMAAYNITPIRIAPVTVPVPMPANASIKLQYVDNQPITLTPTNQYIVIHVTSIVNYSYVFYIATVVQPGKNATTTPPVLVNFQTVVPVPVIGPGIVAQVPVQFSQIGALGSGYYTVTMFAVPFAGGPVISLYPAKLVFTNVYVNTTVV